MGRHCEAYFAKAISWQERDCFAKNARNDGMVRDTRDFKKILAYECSAKLSGKTPSVSKTPGVFTAADSLCYPPADIAQTDGEIPTISKGRFPIDYDQVYVYIEINNRICRQEMRILGLSGNFTMRPKIRPISFSSRKS